MLEETDVTCLPETPFFVVGNPRSGTTLLRFILSSHPRIYIPGETGFLPFLRQDSTGPLSLEQAEALLRHIGQLNRNWLDLVPYPASFHASLPQPTLEQILDALYRRKMAQDDPEAVRWGDKTPGYVRYMHELNAIFPTAQFIHLMRDGRDAALSAQSKWGRERWYMDTYYLLRNWAHNVEAGLRAGQEFGPNRYLEIHYEHLVRAPKPTIRRLCDFLGEEFYPGMLEHTRLARRHIGPGGHVEVRQPISTSSVGRWRSEMSIFERKMANRVAGSTLSRAGYDQAEIPPLSVTESSRLLLLAAKFLLVDSARAILNHLGLWTLNRGKRP